MTASSSDVLLLKVTGSLLLATGAYVVTFGWARKKRYPGRAYVARYLAYVDRMVRLCFVKASAKAIAGGQATGVLVGVMACLATGEAWWSSLSLLSVLSAPAYLTLTRRRRIAAIDAQADGFVLALANSLKAVPNCGAAIESLLPVLRDPIRQEMAIAMKEIRVGTSLEQALLNASARSKSASLDLALSAVLVGRQVGGNLPKVLETTSDTMREMNRLNGVVKSKTAEGRAQLWVLALFPFGICYAFSAVSPGYFDPLHTTIVGQLVAGLAVFLWVGAMLLAKGVLEVDL